LIELKKSDFFFKKRVTKVERKTPQVNKRLKEKEIYRGFLA